MSASGIKPYGKIVTDSKLFPTAHVGGDQRRVTVSETTYTTPPNAGSVLSDWQHLAARAVSLPDLLDLRHESVVGNQWLPSSQDILITDDTLLIHDEIRSLSQASLPIDYPIGINRLEIGIIADERKSELEKIGKSFLRKSHIGADPNNFRVHLLEFGVVVPTGR